MATVTAVEVKRAQAVRELESAQEALLRAEKALSAAGDAEGAADVFEARRRAFWAARALS